MAIVAIWAIPSASALSQNSEANSAELAKGSYNIGVFGTGGFAIDNRYHGIPVFYEGISRPEIAPVRLREFSAGLHAGKVLTAPHGRSFLRGQLEAKAEITPLWLASYPSQKLVFFASGFGTTTTGPISGETRYGINVTPFLVRWDFASSRRFVPWAQLGGGLLWTNHKFPQYPVRTADTSVINFTPQFGIGTNLFVRPRQSLFFAVNAVHISNASLGDRNPGVNVSAQFSVGYSWWK